VGIRALRGKYLSPESDRDERVRTCHKGLPREIPTKCRTTEPPSELVGRRGGRCFGDVPAAYWRM